MKTIIEWHETAKELPEQYDFPYIDKDGKERHQIADKPCLVIWQGKVKPSRYIKETQNWEGHTKEQIPEYWVTLEELKILEEKEVKNDK